MSDSAAINKLAKKHFAVWSHKNGPSHATWSKSESLSYKINYDTIIRNNLFVQAVVCRDSTCTIIQCLTKINHPCAADYGEAQAALFAVELSSSLKRPYILFENDSIIVTIAINNHVITQD